MGKTKKECIEKLEKLKAELGGIKSDKVKPDMRFGDWIEYWYENLAKPRIPDSVLASTPLVSAWVAKVWRRS